MGATGLVAADGVGKDAVGDAELAGVFAAGCTGLVAEGADKTGAAAGFGTADWGDCDGAIAADAPCAAGFGATAVAGFAPVAAGPPPCSPAGCDAAVGRAALAP